MSHDESLEEYDTFLGIMLSTWDHDEMAYLHRRVMHPSYGTQTYCKYCGYAYGDPGCTFCKKSS